MTALFPIWLLPLWIFGAPFLVALFEWARLSSLSPVSLPALQPLPPPAAPRGPVGLST